MGRGSTGENIRQPRDVIFTKLLHRYRKQGLVHIS